jgi:hypothetical protein
MADKLLEGERRETNLVHDAKMIEHVIMGHHLMTIEKHGKQLSMVDVGGYASWDGAFEAAMNNAGM